MSGRDGYAWDAILLSGGGNDLIDDIGKIIKKFSKKKSDPAEYCDLDELDKTLASVEKGYRKIIELNNRGQTTIYFMSDHLIVVCPEWHLLKQ